ncbi:unnamed protein product [Staurois parvus]|uniref:Uncharacterized protein n=1 Tax=Staurois parvus TaxID=386267 RepID=A0ABN9E4D6_9NEOB|nr:unnamed protein product [Staurois parvus]
MCHFQVSSHTAAYWCVHSIFLVHRVAGRLRDLPTSCCPAAPKSAIGPHCIPSLPSCCCPSQVPQ